MFLKDFKEYKEGLILISELNNLPNTVIVDGVNLVKSFRDTNRVEDSKYLTSSFDTRYVACGFGGRDISGKFIVAEVECCHKHIGQDYYLVSIKNKDILDKLLGVVK